MTKIKKILLAGLAFFSFCISAFPQTITTASEYFKSISDFYATLKDYEADMEIRADKQEMSAKVSYKKPNLMRIDFSSPENQVIVYNGDMLTIYLPGSSAVLQQVVQSEKTGANMATAQGLSLMSRYYSVGYEVDFVSKKSCCRSVYLHKNCDKSTNKTNSPYSSVSKKRRIYYF